LRVEIGVLLGQSHPSTGHHSHPTAILIAPTKGLTRGEGCGQIVIRQGEGLFRDRTRWTFAGRKHRLVGKEGSHLLSWQFGAAFEGF